MGFGLHRALERIGSHVDSMPKATQHSHDVTNCADIFRILGGEGGERVLCGSGSAA